MSISLSGIKSMTIEIHICVTLISACVVGAYFVLRQLLFSFVFFGEIMIVTITEIPWSY